MFSAKNVILPAQILIMTLKDILVISGQSGLFKYVNKDRNHVIVENLVDHKRTIIKPVTSKISMLGDITVFTTTGNIGLREIFQKIQAKEKGNAAIPHKSSDVELKNYFAEVLPEYDKIRVYQSDIRKIVLWYNLLVELGYTDFAAPETTEESEEEGESESESFETETDAESDSIE